MRVLEVMQQPLDDKEKQAYLEESRVGTIKLERKYFYCEALA